MLGSFKYAWEIYDEETGLYYLRARYYDPSIGRFINEDTYEGQIDNPLSQNLYTYVHNNPLINIDPTGHVVETIIDIGSMGYSAYEFYNHPSWKNAAFLLWDTASVFLPFVPGSYVGRTLSTAEKFREAKTGVWALGFSKRGYKIEKDLGGMVNNFPTIDKFVLGKTGVAQSVTSIKSLDISGKTYEKSNKLYSTLMNYVNKLDDFSTTTYGGLTVRVDSQTKRILELALPPVQLTKSQAAELDKAIADASKQGIQIIVKIVE
ncbi:RHS repeat-associated core domain-containing protein [Paenibacillus sp. FSL R7-0345]|uniref:RHS repeat-associated core domain-containing protein n=2 Tax=Paenibacillus sp. FSL R7-0345 TaxID=2954535 RepID=UPI003159C38A